jgi:hypothetical protein
MAPDDISEWRRAHDRVCTLVLDAGDDAMEVTVPATPAWTARDLLSHMVGLGADVLAGDEPDDHHATWTQAQVEARRGRPASALVREWRSLAPDLVDWMRLNGTRPLGDVVIHEQDLRGALRMPGARDTPGLDAVRERMLGRWRAAVADLPPVLLDAGDRRWVSHGTDDDAATVLQASGFDLFRALTARRTEAQLRSWVARGDVQPYLAGFSGLGPLPAEPLPGE